MICKECGNAGEMNWLRNTNTASPEIAQLLKQGIISRHALCKGGTWCDCQHVVGVVMY